MRTAQRWSDGTLAEESMKGILLKAACMLRSMRSMFRRFFSLQAFPALERIFLPTKSQLYLTYCAPFGTVTPLAE
jgi:hypothetical protein